ncbi:MAG: hypothetical protein CVV27_02660 [Candidatus Melainabacteria bacterium HGW-Melainabacteria-1]|nr:MAG: hypothetical protein CVV27_02660 [Candidatus Melainabacteria bacterium HGW-Melainabacteria-1]
MVKVKTVTNPTLDGSGRFTVEFTQFQKVINAVVSGSDGYVPHVKSISGHTVTIEVRQSGALAHAGGAADVAHTTTDLTALTDHDNNPTYHAVHPKADIAAAIAGHATAVLAACSPGAIVAVFSIMANGI